MRQRLHTICSVTWQSAGFTIAIRVCQIYFFAGLAEKSMRICRFFDFDRKNMNHTIPGKGMKKRAENIIAKSARTELSGGRQGTEISRKSGSMAGVRKSMRRCGWIPPERQTKTAAAVLSAAAVRSAKLSCTLLFHHHFQAHVGKKGVGVVEEQDVGDGFGRYDILNIIVEVPRVYDDYLTEAL